MQDFPEWASNFEFTSMLGGEQFTMEKSDVGGMLFADTSLPNENQAI